MAKKIEVILELETRDFDAGVRKVNTGINKVENSAKGLGSTLKGIGAALAGGFAVKGVVDATLKMEEFRTTLTAYLGDQEAANAAIANLSELANKLPQDLDDVTQAFIILKRNGVDTANESIEAFAKVAAGNGKSMEQLAEGVADALTGEFERLKEFGIKVSKENDQFVMRMADGSQKIVDSTAEVIETLREQGEEGGKFAGVVAGPLSQAFSNLRGITLEVAAAFGDGLAPALSDASTGIKEALVANKELIASIGELVGNALALLLENLDLVIAAISGFAAAWAAVKLGGIITSIKTMITTFGTLNAVMAANPIGLVATAIGLLVAGLMALEQHTGLVSEAFVYMGNGIIEIINGVGNHIESMAIKVVGIGGIIKDAFDPSNWGEGFFGGISEALEQVKADAQAAFDEDPITFRFGVDEEASQSVVGQLQEIEVSATRVAETYQKVSDKMSEADKERERLHERDLKRADVLLERWEDKNKNLERETEIMEAIQGMSEEESRLKKELMKIEFNRRDALKEIENMLVSDAERNELTRKLNELTQEQIELEKKRHAENMDHKDKEAQANEANNKKRREIEQETSDLIKDLNTQTYNSMENAFVDFVSTGKLSFKDLVDEMLDQLKRLVAKQIFKTILGIFGGGVGAGLSSIFDFLDTGGIIPAGKFGIVGEKGPELVSGPGKVVGRKDTERLLDKAGENRNTQGSTNVTYNISAVDAQSFKELVASDPEFIFNVTQAGARLQPI